MGIETGSAIILLEINIGIFCFAVYSLLKETSWFKKKSFGQLVIEEIKAVPTLNIKVDSCMNMADMTRTNVINIAKKGQNKKR